jgi:hypothetical protein
MLKHWILGLGLALSAGMQGLAAADRHDQDEPNAIPLPPHARLLGASEVDEIRVLPELQGRKAAERVMGVAALDRTYQSSRSYADTVAFFDGHLKSGEMQIVDRVTTPTSTAWMVKRGDGTTAALVVRNTKPASFESIQVVGAAVNVPTPGEPSPGEPSPSTAPNVNPHGAMPTTPHGAMPNSPQGTLPTEPHGPMPGEPPAH